MNIVSIITPVDVNRIDYLEDAARSISLLDIPSSYRIQWCLQIDGKRCLEVEKLVNYLRKKLYNSLNYDVLDVESNTYSVGAAAARNLAASRAKGTILKMLDADDMLSKNCLKKRIINI